MEEEKNHQVNESSKFGLLGAVMYGVNVVLGTGILLLPKDIYADLGPASIVAMVFCTILVFLLAFCYAEVSSYFSKNGGAYQYAKATFGELPAFVIGILAWFTVTAVWSASASGLAELIGRTFPAFADYVPIMAAIVIVVFTLLNLAGIRAVKIFTITVTISKMIPMFAVGIIGIFFLSNGIEVGNYTPFVQLSEGSSLFGALASTAMTVFYAFVGFESLPIIAGEVRNPRKNMPLAILISLTLVSVLYILIIAAAISTLGADLLLTDTPIQDAFAQMVGQWGFWFITVGALVSLIGLNVGDSTHSPRMLEAVAEDGYLPSFISRKNNAGTPVNAILITSAISLGLVLTGSFEKLVELSVVFYFFQYIPTAIALLYIRKKGLRTAEESVQQPFKIAGGKVIAVLAVIISIWMIVADNVWHIVTGAVGVVIAIAVFYLFNFNKLKK